MKRLTTRRGFRRGRARPRGSVRGIMAQGEVIPKEPGDVVGVEAAIGASTTDSEGVLIPWTYKVRATLIHVASDTVASEVCDDPGCATIERAPGGHIVNLSLPVPQDAAPGGYLVSVELHANTSDAQGQPTTETTVLDIVDSSDLVDVGGGPATPGGAVGNIVLSQRR